MRFILFFLINTFFISQFLFSQDKINVTYQLDSRGNYSFYCTNIDYCKYNVRIYFKELTNLKSNKNLPYITDVYPGSNFLFTLEKVDERRSSSFNYNYKCIRGCVNPKVDPNFTYLLPVGEGKTTIPFNIEYLKINDKNPEPKDFYVIGFKLDLGDTIFAARRGIVISYRDTTKLTLNGYRYSSEDNFIEIFHNDCSFGKYQVLKKSLVKIGQEVEAGEPIAISGGEKYISGPHVRFFVYYNYEQEFESKLSDGSNVKRYWAYIPLVFYTKEENKSRLSFNNKYTSVHPDSIITQEMTKREIRKWIKNHCQ